MGAWIVQQLRHRIRWGRVSLELWQWAALVVCTPLGLLNLAVGFFGNSVVFPLSPFYVGNKLHALARYAVHRPVCWVRGHPDVDAVVAEAERANNLPRGLLASVVEMESAHRPHRISPAGAMGPAQLIPSTAQMLEVSDPFDTQDSIQGGARYLAMHVKRYRSLPLAIAAYNAGPGAVDRSIPRNGETEVYVQRVMAEYSRRRATFRAEARARARLQQVKPAKR